MATVSERAGTVSPLIAIGIPVVLLVLLVGGLVLLDPAARFETAAPPAEDLAFERVELTPGRLVLHVRNVGATTNTVEQVLVDDAYWLFSMEPGRTLDRFARGVITLEYPWVEGEAYVVKVLTSTGTPFEHEIAVAVPAPARDAASYADLALIGVLVGVVPVVVGMAFLPALRRIADRHYDAILALTLGVLAFLLVDTVVEGLELAEELPGALHGTGVLFASALVALLLVLALERAVRGRGSAFAVALLIALAIGLHNLGEGLLIGAAFALGSLALASALIVGFALHNVTEGPAIVSPLAKGGRVGPARFLALAALGGVPTIAGTWLGAFSSTGILSVVFFGLGAGAIVVVLVQVALQMRRDGSPFTPINALAFAAGFLVMLATAFLVG